MNGKVKIKEHLKSWDAFLDAFGDLLPGGIGVYEIADERIRPIYLSQGVYRLCNGFDERFYERVKKSAEFLLIEKDYMKLRNELKSSYDEKKTLDCTLRYHKNPKRNGWVWVRGKALAAGKKRNLFIALILDVTQKKELENELLVQNERYRILEETSDEILFEIDLAEDVMTYSYKEMDGELIRRRIPHYSRSLKEEPMVHPDSEEIFQKNLMLAIHKKMDCQLEYLTKISGHGYEWHRACYSSIEDENGNITRIIGRIKNIHDEVLKRRKSAAGVGIDLKNHAGVQMRVRDSLDNAELEDKHAMAIISLNHYRRIIEQNGVAWGDTAMQKIVTIIRNKTGVSSILGRLEDGKVLLYIKNVDIMQFDEGMKEIVNMVEHVDNKIANLTLTCSIGAAVMQGVADYSSFIQEVEEALHIAKITKGESYIRV